MAILLHERGHRQPSTGVPLYESGRPPGRNGDVGRSLEPSRARGYTVRRTVLERFPAGGPRGSWPAEEFAAARRVEGMAAEVVMDLEEDAFLVVVPQQSADRGH